MKTAFELPDELATGLVDAHAHITQRGGPLIAERHSRPEIDVSATDYVNLLHEHGLQYGVLTAPSFYGTDNTLLLAALREYPQALRGVVNVDPGVAAGQLAEWDAMGVVGVRFNMIRREPLPDFSAQVYQDLFEKIKGLDWHVEVYVESHRFPRVAAPILESGAMLVIDHFGYPVEPEGVDGAGFRGVLAGLRTGRASVKLSAPYRIPLPSLVPVVQAIREAGGVESMVWASDWPWVSFSDGLTYEGCMAGLVQWLPDPRDRYQVLSGNARRLFHFP